MYMKKILTILITTSLLMPASSAVRAAYDPATAQGYLLAHNTSPWSVMGLSALAASNISAEHLRSVSATNAIQYAAPILALTAIGQDPRTFPSSDYAAGLKSFHRDGQLGDPRTLNDDIFGLLALISAGVPADDPAVTDAKSFLLAHQTGSGGWGITVTSSADTNMTASAILALRATGLGAADQRIKNALAYLRSAQNDDGGFPYDPASAFGRTSDTSSTAWVAWALNTLTIPLDSWSRGDNTPKTFLEARQTPSGYFEYQSGSAEDSFSAITTSYAVIALAGKSLPLRTLTPPAQTNQFDFRIEGSQSQICAGKTAGPTALDIIRTAAASCGFTYHFSQTDLGPYVDQINTDRAAGQTGWLYLVNYRPPSVGAADYRLQAGDQVLWFYGEFNWQPTRLTLSASDISSSVTVTATVEAFVDNHWRPLEAVTVAAGSQRFLTDATGRTTFSLPDGSYQIVASKDGFIRSSVLSLTVGSTPTTAVNLTVTINQPSPQQDTIAFTVEPGSINFGALVPGGSVEKNVKLKNTGNVSIRLTSSVSGDPLFRDNLSVNAAPWQRFRLSLGRSLHQIVPLRLSIPSANTAHGQKSASLTFWATAN